MLVKIVDNHFLYLDQITAQQDEIIYRHFSAKDPDAMYIIDTLEQDWDGWYRKYNRQKQRMALPFLNELLVLCKGHGWPVSVLDRRPKIWTPSEEDVKPDILPGITLYGYQMEALKMALRHPIGCFFHTTGAGKTELMAALIRLFKCSALIISEKLVIVDQIKRVIEMREVASDVGVFYSGRTPTGQLVCVGSIQSIATPSKPVRQHGMEQEEFDKKMAQYTARCKRSKQLQQLLLPKCEMLLVDECDLATSTQYRNLFKLSEARRRYGFSGSLGDPNKPVQNLVLKERLGSVIHKTNRRELEKLGRIIPVKYVMIAFGEGRDKTDRTAYDIAIKELENNPAFIQTIAGIVRVYPRRTLILVEHRALGHALEEAIPGSLFIHGDTSGNARWEAIHDFEKDKLGCLIGGKIIKRGLDLKGGCDNLIIAHGMKDLADFEQRIGRAIRKNKEGFARVFDFMFLHNTHLYGHSRARLKYLVNMGYNSVVVYPQADVKIDGASLIRSRFHIPRPKQP